MPSPAGLRRILSPVLLSPENRLLNTVKFSVDCAATVLHENRARKERMENQKGSTINELTETNQQWRQDNPDGVAGDKASQRRNNDVLDAAANGDDVDGSSAPAENHSRISPQSVEANEHRNHVQMDLQMTRVGQGGQYPPFTNDSQNYYPINGNINPPAPYWTHYCPEMYPMQAGIFLPLVFSNFAPQPGPSSSFTSSYQPSQPQHQQSTRHKPLPKPDRSETFSIYPSPQPLSIPGPSQDYILNASLPPFRTPDPARKLLVLDLNGTLLHRPRNPQRERNADMRKASKHPILRPYLHDFMSYVFSHFSVMFWSSAKPHNVEAMIKAATSPEQREQIVGIWDRDRFGLSAEAYNAKSVTIKDLELVFGSSKVGGKKRRWDCSNTVLLDDSVVKATYQPYNHVCIPEFSPPGEGQTEEDEALREVAGYLEELRYQGHVARFIKQRPFRMADGWDRPF